MIWISLTINLILLVVIGLLIFAIRSFNARINELEKLLTGVVAAASESLTDLLIVSQTPVLQDDMIVQQLIRSVQRARDTMITVKDAIQFDLDEDEDEDEA